MVSQPFLRDDCQYHLQPLPKTHAQTVRSIGPDRLVFQDVGGTKIAFRSLGDREAPPVGTFGVPLTFNYAQSSGRTASRRKEFEVADFVVNHSAFADLVRQLSDGFADQLGKLRQQRRPSHAELAVLFHHRSRGATKLDEPPWQRSHHPITRAHCSSRPENRFWGWRV